MGMFSFDEQFEYEYNKGFLDGQNCDKCTICKRYNYADAYNSIVKMIDNPAITIDIIDKLGRMWDIHFDDTQYMMRH